MQGRVTCIEYLSRRELGSRRTNTTRAARGIDEWNYHIMADNSHPNWNSRLLMQLPLEQLGPAWAGSAGIAFMVAGQEQDAVIQGQPAAFALFVNKDGPVGSCSWSIKRVEETGTEIPVETVPVKSFQVRWAPKVSGQFRITAEVFAGSGVVDSVSVIQIVRPFNEHISRIAELRNSKDPRLAPLPGSLEVFNRLVYSIYPLLQKVTNTAVTIQCLAVHCYAALSTVRSGRTIKGRTVPLESLLAPKTPKEEFSEVFDLPTDLRPMYREGPFGLALVHAALFCMADKLKIKSPSAMTPRQLENAFAAMPDLDKLILCTKLRFPQSSLDVLLKGVEYCMREWKAMAQLNTVTGPDELTAEEREATLAGLLMAGGPTLAPIASKKFKAPFQHTFQTNRHQFAFDVFLWPTSDQVSRRTEWEGANEGDDGAADDTWRETVSKAFVGGYYNYIFLYGKYQDWANGLKGDSISELEIDLEDSIDSDGKAVRHWVNPVQWLKQNLVRRMGKAKIFGAAFICHKILAEKLSRAETNLKGLDVRFTPKQAGSFMPRLINPGGKLSNHAVGLGIDFDCDANPLLIGITKSKTMVKHFRLLRDMFDIDLSKSTSYRHSEDCNAQFRDRFTEVFGDQLELIKLGFPIGSLVDAESAQVLLKAYNAGGFLTIPFDVVRECVEVQKLGWGGYYRNKRDYMHFEYPAVIDAPDDDF